MHATMKAPAGLVGAARKHTQQRYRTLHMSYTVLASACLLAAYSVALVKITPVFQGVRSE